MDECCVYLITSCKGGVGKSTVAVNLAFAMALTGSVVLLADCDTKNRTADLMLGYEGVGLFDLSDVDAGRSPPEDAILRDRLPKTHIGRREHEHAEGDEYHRNEDAERDM